MRKAEEYMRDKMDGLLSETDYKSCSRIAVMIIFYKYSCFFIIYPPLLPLITVRFF